MHPAGLTWRPAPPTRVIRRASRVIQRHGAKGSRSAPANSRPTPVLSDIAFRSGPSQTKRLCPARRGSVELDEADFLKFASLPSGVAPAPRSSCQLLGNARRSFPDHGEKSVCRGGGVFAERGLGGGTKESASQARHLEDHQTYTHPPTRAPARAHTHTQE